MTLQLVTSCFEFKYLNFGDDFLKIGIRNTQFFNALSSTRISRNRRWLPTLTSLHGCTADQSVAHASTEQQNYQRLPPPHPPPTHPQTRTFIYIYIYSYPRRTDIYGTPVLLVRNSDKPRVRPSAELNATISLSYSIEIRPDERTRVHDVHAECRFPKKIGASSLGGWWTNLSVLKILYF